MPPPEPTPAPLDDARLAAIEAMFARGRWVDAAELTAEVRRLRAEVERLRTGYALSEKDRQELGARLIQAPKWAYVTELRSEVERLKAEAEAITKLCYYQNKNSRGRRFYTLLVSALPDQEIDFDTEDEARHAVRIAARLEPYTAPDSEDN